MCLLPYAAQKKSFYETLQNTPNLDQGFPIKTNGGDNHLKISVMTSPRALAGGGHEIKILGFDLKAPKCFGLKPANLIHFSSPG